MRSTEGLRMKTTAKTSATVTILLLLCTISFAQEQAPSPAYQDGDWWRFRVTQREWASSSSSRLQGDYEVRFSGGEFRVYELKAGKKTEVQRAAELKRMVDNNRDDRQYLQFPLAVGNKWTK